MEQWRAIPEWPEYEVSDAGRVRSIDRTVHYTCRWGTETTMFIAGQELSYWTDKWGYRRVCLYRNGKRERKTTGIHNLVMLAFVGPVPKGEQVLHRISDPADNRLSNLRYGTLSENIRQTVVEGKHSQARKTKCPKGHDYDEQNTYRDKRGRQCRACAREKARERTAI